VTDYVLVRHQRELVYVQCPSRRNKDSDSRWYLVADRRARALARSCRKLHCEVRVEIVVVAVVVVLAPWLSCLSFANRAENREVYTSQVAR